MSRRVLIIAEAGVNHNGSLERAQAMVDAAVAAGADVIKFQSFRTDRLVTPDAPKAAYQASNTGNQGSQYSMLKKLELSEEDHIGLINYCRQQGITFLSTPFDGESADMLDKLGVTMFKVGSGDLTNLPLLRQLAAYGKPVILSTGMANMDEIDQALNGLARAGLALEKITVLHANTDYPTAYADVNLRAMQAIADTFGVTVGYSDHSDGIEVPVAAVAMGARVIEKHFTLDRNLEGPDHKASLEPAALEQMCRSIRHIEEALGSGIKVPSAGERKNMAAARKSIVAARDIQQGERLTPDNLTVKRPGTGISPLRWDEIIGTFATREYRKDELIG